MKITLTATQQKNIEFGYPNVTIEVFPDDQTISEMFEQLIRPALIAAGYAKESIDSYLCQGKE